MEIGLGPYFTGAPVPSKSIALHSILYFILNIGCEVKVTVDRKVVKGVRPPEAPRI